MSAARRVRVVRSRHRGPCGRCGRVLIEDNVKIVFLFFIVLTSLHTDTYIYTHMDFCSYAVCSRHPLCVYSIGLAGTGG